MSNFRIEVQLDGVRQTLRGDELRLEILMDDGDEKISALVVTGVIGERPLKGLLRLDAEPGDDHARSLRVDDGREISIVTKKRGR